MTSKQPDPRYRVFDAIVNHWVKNRKALELLVQRIETEKELWRRRAPGRRSWSFELALNSWAREGCRAFAGWSSPDSGLNIYPNKRWSVDALVTPNGDTPVAVEVALVTNVTMDKWIAKIDHDTEKLANYSPYAGLQIVACVDTFDLEEVEEDWMSWLSRTRIWNRQTSMIVRHGILNEGKLLVKGWAIPKSVR